MTELDLANKLVFGNITNNLMIGHIEESYSQGMNRVMSRKIWLCNKNDIIVIPAEIRDDFKEYVYDLIGLEENDIEIFEISGSDNDSLIKRVKESDSFESLKEAIRKRPDIRFLGFGYDQETLDFAKELELPLLGYTGYPNEDSLQMFYDINTKHGFRTTVQSLGLKVSDGVFCENAAAVPQALADMFKKHERVILKFNRSSNGFGHLVLERESLTSLEKIEKAFSDHLTAFPNQPREFVIEKYQTFLNLPSIELTVEEDGSTELYTCDQYCYNNSWAGMITPPTNLTDEQYAELQHAGDLFGKHVHKNGFRGVCDVDAGITEEGEVFLTESNFRRTGGTYLDFIVRRLVDPNYFFDQSCFWIADTKLADTIDYVSFKQIADRVKASGLAFNKETKKGVILTTMTYELDNKWRYLVIGDSEQYVKQKEQELAQLLNFKK